MIKKYLTKIIQEILSDFFQEREFLVCFYNIDGRTLITKKEMIVVPGLSSIVALTLEPSADPTHTFKIIYQEFSEYGTVVKCYGSLREVHETHPHPRNPRTRIENNH